MKLRKLLSLAGRMFVVAACSIATAPVSAFAYSEHFTDTPDFESLTFAIPKYQTGLNLRWQANVGMSSGHFVLYWWSADGSQIVEVSETVAKNGTFQYSFQDRTAHAPFGTYRLVFRSALGVETTLLEAQVDIDERLAPEGLAATSSNPQPIVVHSVADMNLRETTSLFKWALATMPLGVGAAAPKPPP